MRAPRQTTPWPLARPAVMFSAIAAASAGVSGALAWGHPILASRWLLLWRLAAWGALWAAGVLIAWRLPRRAFVPLLLCATVLVRAAALAGPPITSDDLYRYTWDGRVQAAGTDPYRYPPAAPQLAGLREPWLWPSAAGCARIRRPPGCTRINRPAQRTIYPPVAEAWFAAVYNAGGVGARHKLWQAAGLAVDVVAVWLLVVALRRWGRDARWAALYGLCPAPVLELVNNGHVDGLAIALMIGALLVARPPPAGAPSAGGRLVARDLAVGVLVGAAALVKLYPGFLLVALVGLAGPRPWLRVARATAASLVLAGVTYAPHVAAVGSKVLGYLLLYLREEHYTKGGRYLLAGALGIHGSAATTAAIAALAGAVTWVGWRRPPPPRGVLVLIGVLLLVTTPVQPWYAVSVVALAALAGRPWWVAVTVAGYPYFFAVILASRHAVVIGEAAYGLAAMIVVAGEVVASRSSRPDMARSRSPYGPVKGFMGLPEQRPFRVAQRK